MPGVSIPPVNVRLNIGVSCSSAVVSAVVGLSIIPIQLRLLGAEAYGLLGFCVTIQSLLMALDIGMPATVNREVARCQSGADRDRAAGLIGALDRICWALGALCATVIAVFAPGISSNWLNAVDLPGNLITQCLVTAGFLVALRWPITLYQSALLGAQRVVLNSAINVVVVTGSAAAGIGVLVFVAPDVRLLLISQAAGTLLHLLALRLAVARHVLGRARWTASFGEVRRVWRFSAVTGLVTAVGVCFMQIDKLLLSRLLSLEQFGYYSIATVVASGLYVATMPVFSVVYPRLSALHASGDRTELERLYRNTSHFLAAVLAPTGIVMALFSADLLTAWAGNAVLAAEVAPVAALLSLGSALHGIMFLPFALTLAHGAASLALRINVALLVCVVPIIVAGASGWGATGAAAGWLLLHVTYLVAGSYATHRTLWPQLRYHWLATDIGVPLAWAAGMALAGAWMAAGLDMGLAVRIAFAGALWAACVGCAFMSSPVFRHWAWQHVAPT